MISLNDNELEALRILWEHGDLKPADIQDRFSWPIENATLRSVLVNLVAKKQANRRLQGKAFFYAAYARPNLCGRFPAGTGDAADGNVRSQAGRHRTVAADRRGSDAQIHEREIT
jgi:hypothetical protein